MNRRALYFFVIAMVVLLTQTASGTVLGQLNLGLEPVDLVKYWYRTLGQASGSRGFYNGTVGDPAVLETAYRMLALSFQDRTPLTVFQEMYATVANVKLLQAQPIEMDIGNKEAIVFVEEQRTIIFDQSGQKIPGIAWYAGTVRLSLLSGHWQITALDLTPEDIVSLGLGGHSPWRANPEAVAIQKVAEVTARRAEPTPNSPEPQLHVCRLQPHQESGFSTVAICADKPYDVRLVQLHSGEWHVLSAAPVPPGSR